MRRDRRHGYTQPKLANTILHRAVYGAVVNASHGHPDVRLPDYFARSVAKRASGTLAPYLQVGSDALAASRRSLRRQGAVRPDLLKLSEDTRGGRACHGPPGCHKELLIALSKIATAFHKSGRTEEFQALVMAGRAIKAHARESSTPETSK